MGDKMTRINVTKTFLPPLKEFEAYLEQIWQSGYITNQGPLLKQFEADLQSYLGVENLHFVNNGTTALQLALNSLDITGGEVITTPFTYVATTSSILWERCEPVFVDIESDTYCIDPTKIEAAITPKTRAIMGVHVFGFPCDVDKIQEIADAHDLKVIYDAAHAFGAEYKGKSLLSYGDVSTSSFHATKLFHTIEGGCVVAKDGEVSKKIELIKRFGHDGDTHFRLGINAKANELQAAMGLCNLKYIDDILESRKRIYDLYQRLLDDSVVKRPAVPDNLKQNYIYYPVRFKDEQTLLRVEKALNDQDIYPRRYFYPSLNTLAYLDSNQSCPISEAVASTILCLPLYAGLEEADVRRIVKIINAQ